MMSQWVNNPGNLRSGCLARGYCKFGSKKEEPGGIFQCGVRKTSQVNLASGMWAHTAVESPLSDHPQHSRVRISTLYIYPMLWCTTEFEGGHRVLCCLTELLFFLQILSVN
jgi:hypothetical protein